jgi:NAD+ synthase (glutamine-hydrolysing)
MDTPISPELLPPDEKGNRPEDGGNRRPLYPADFFTFYTFATDVAEKMLFIARWSSPTIIRRSSSKNGLPSSTAVFAQQFKRSCIPDGPKVGSVSLSPRGDGGCPATQTTSAWLKELSE